MELALYGALLKVSISFTKFLKSYEKSYNEDTDEAWTIR